MGILSSFDNIPENYIPRNTTKSVGRRKQVRTRPPFQSGTNAFWWNQGDQFIFIYRPQLKIYVEDTAVVLDGEPTESFFATVGFRGQKAYDVANLVSYTYMAGYNGVDGWQTDTLFTIPAHGTQEVALKNIDWDNVTIKFEIRNFRDEVIFYHPESEEDTPITVQGDGTVALEIEETLSALLKYGSYKFIFILNGANEYAPLYLQTIYDISILQKRISNTRDSVFDTQTEDG